VSFPNRGELQTARGDGQGAVHDACYIEQWYLVLLMSANATGTKLEPGLLVLGCDRQVDLAVKGKVSIP
jgi:hypothetical protein